MDDEQGLKPMSAVDMSHLPAANQARKLKTRSSFSGYEPQGHDLSSSTQQQQHHSQQEDHHNLGDSEENNRSGNKNVTSRRSSEKSSQSQKSEPKQAKNLRRTDGYFNPETEHHKHTNPNPPLANKNKKKKHIYARKATYLTSADKKKLKADAAIATNEGTNSNSLVKEDEYRQYDTSYQDLGYGCIVNTFAMCCNIYMQLFSNMMRFCGRILTRLEQKYTSANVGYGMMIMSNTIYLVPTIFIKCNPQVDFSLAIMTRGVLTVFFICQMAHVKGQELFAFPSHDFRRLCFRGIFTSVSQLYFFFALGKLPLSINMIISNTGPIFVFLISVVFFDGHLRLNDVIGILIAVFGVFCVSNPQSVTGFFTGGHAAAVAATEATAAAAVATAAEVSGGLLESVSEAVAAHAKSAYQYVEGMDRLIVIVAYLVVYVGWAYSVLIVKQLKQASTLAMNFFVALCFALVGAITMMFRPASIFDLSGMDVFYLIFVVGMFSFAYQYTFITSTFLNHNHGPLTMLGYLSVIKSYIIQVVFFNEVPSTAEIIGSILVLIGVAKIVIH